MTESDWSAVTQLEEEMRMVPEEGLTENSVTMVGSQHEVGDLGAPKSHLGGPAAPSVLQLFQAWSPHPIQSSDSDHIPNNYYNFPAPRFHDLRDAQERQIHL